MKGFAPDENPGNIESQQRSDYTETTTQPKSLAHFYYLCLHPKNEKHMSAVFYLQESYQQGIKCISVG